MKTIKLSLATLGAFGALTAHSAGFEKATTWSGRNTAIGNAAASSVSGPESLFFNPAGLGSGTGVGVSAQFSPTSTQAEGPVLQDDKSLKSKRQFSPVFGVLSDYAVNDKTAVGVGAFVTGGTKAVYDDISFTDLNSSFKLTGRAESNISLIEVSPGVSYRVSPSVKVGAAWRASFVKGQLGSVAYTDLNKVNGAIPVGSYVAQSVLISDLSGTAFTGFRVGAQYAPEGANWGLGLSVRTPIKFKLDGTSSMKAQYMGGGALAAANALNPDAKDGTGGDVTVESELPTQVSVGGNMSLAEGKVGFFLEYAWTNYKRVKAIDVNGKIVTPSDLVNSSQQAALGGTGTVLAGQVNGKEKDLPDFNAQWKDQHQAKIGAEFRYVEGFPIRVGYILTSQVVPDDYARATFSSPGFGQTFTAGVGMEVSEVSFDLGAEYSRASGSSAGKAGSDTTTSADDTLKGEYKTAAYAAHIGATYRF
jgi:long-subunit fatty acid transport protein